MSDKIKENNVEEAMFITGVSRNNEILILANAINYNAELLQKALDKISKLEKGGNLNNNGRKD